MKIKHGAVVGAVLSNGNMRIGIAIDNIGSIWFVDIGHLNFCELFEKRDLIVLAEEL
jgi:hypothetical protein